MRIAFFSSMLLASSLATAATPIDGLYGSFFGGYTYIPDNLSKLHNNIKFTHAVYNNGFNAGGRFGYQSNNWRYEGEITYLRTTVNSFRFNRRFPISTLDVFRVRDVNGQTNTITGIANLYYDFPEMVPCIAPFLGAGIGFGWFGIHFSNDFNHNRHFFENPNFFFRNPTIFQNPFFRDLHYSGSSSAFVYQGTAGLTYNFTENYALNLAYRYIGSTRISALGKVLQSHSASVGVVYRFNEYNYK
jgi:opacity protein-like surface antigen